ncbi:MAG: Na+/H+ antiporter NhaA [Gemmatimonadetes bacterium]|nr:Na+/H+ antiporter NhaA [Gemmatimonadota bacterium]MXY82280.1 Na+/H+ antiporter NhaA [Gemmatimonadota bacterium]MYB71257.1 Na+/H+ antiporter NhaA [Gemmatimonadota bacterium]
MPIRAIREFMRYEATAGFLLFAAATVAIILANTALAPIYGHLLDVPLAISVGASGLAKPLLLWINDGLMAVFFLLVGLEIKREFIEGQLSTTRQALLPFVGAVGGMVLPAGIYIYLNFGHDPLALNGWAIPAATDIAFALGILALVGSRAPLALKVLLTAIAILDDLAAIIIIAVFYTDQLSLEAVEGAILCMVGLIILSRLGVERIAAYVLFGVALWVFVLKIGVHATLAGVLVALAVPMRSRADRERSPLKELEHALHPWVAYGILPLFAFANAGVSFAGVTPSSLFEPVPLGIAAGLFLGKQLGVFLPILVAIRLGIAEKPEGATWLQIYGVAALCGVGFTMSLFIGSLAFENPADDQSFAAPIRLGVLSGSLLSGLLGYLLVRFGASRSGPPLAAASQ